LKANNTTRHDKNVVAFKENEMKVNIKQLHPDSVIPTYAKHGDAGMDLTAISKEYDEHGNICYSTGLAFEIPSGFAGFLFPRSSNTKKDLILGNSVGVIDSGYRGEVVLKFKKHPSVKRTAWGDVAVGMIEEYEIGDRVGQIVIMPVPQIEFNLVDELSSSDRGVGAFGSTDPVTSAIESNCE